MISYYEYYSILKQKKLLYVNIRVMSNIKLVRNIQIEFSGLSCFRHVVTIYTKRRQSFIKVLLTMHKKKREV